MAAPSEKTHVDRGSAQTAYSALDVEQSAAAHANRTAGGHAEEHSAVGGRMRTVVFGGLDGILTSFAIVSSCAGSAMEPRVVLLLGLCNIFADALAMGVGERVGRRPRGTRSAATRAPLPRRYLSTKSNDEFARFERSREAWEMTHNPEGEIDEMVDIYVGRGMGRDDARNVISTMAKSAARVRAKRPPRETFGRKKNAGTPTSS